jgi:hypothetical protein
VKIGNTSRLVLKREVKLIYLLMAVVLLLGPCYLAQSLSAIIITTVLICLDYLLERSRLRCELLSGKNK